MTRTQQRQPEDVSQTETKASTLEGLVGYNLKRAYVVILEDFRAALGKDGLSSRVFAALTLTIENPNITQSALARKLGIERSGLVAIVDELEQRDYLKRTPVPGDRRVQALAPTKTGQAAHAKMVKSVRAHEDRLFADMTSDEKQILLSLLKKIRGIEDR